MHDEESPSAPGRHVEPHRSDDKLPSLDEASQSGPSHGASHAPARSLRFLLAAVGLLLLGVAAFVYARSDTERLLREAEAAMNAEDFARCEQLTQQVLERRPNSPRALALAGMAAAQQSDPQRAMTFFDRLPADGSKTSTDAACLAANLLIFQLARPAEAEARLRAVLEHDPDHLLANTQMVAVLGLSGRRREAIPHLLQLLRQDQFSVDQLVLLGAIGGAQYDVPLLEKWSHTSPDDPVVLQGLAWHEISRNNFEQAEQHLRKALAIDSDLPEAQIRLGTILLEKSPTEFAVWNAQAPETIDDDSRTWSLRGTWQQRRQNPQTAARCFWEAVRRDPNDQRANYQLGQILSELGRTQQAQPFLERARQLQNLRDVETRLLNAEQHTLEPLRQIVQQMEALGRLWEAWGWSRIAWQIDPSARWPLTEATRLRDALEDDPPQTLTSHNPALKVDLSDLPPPSAEAPPTDDSRGNPSLAGVEIRFANDASAVGLDFTYFNDGDPQTPGQCMYEFGGGGVAALDFDADGWPDLYFTQGCDWSRRGRQTKHLDRLFRNLGDGQFLDVTQHAHIAEDRYSQGVAAGDVNNDGFPDLFIANIGVNRLYLNNGDGTFSDVSDAAGMTIDRWTTSALIADLNGDACPEIVAVNYLEGDDLFERLCRHPDGVPRMCAPFDFDGSQDEAYLNLGDGRFREVAAEAGLALPDGKGLGIVAADFEGTGRLNLFVANDLTANFYFVNQTASPGEVPHLEDQALLSGVAYDEAGRTQGCMGIAVGDADADGRLDLFVTNFLEETNAFYVQQPGGYFREQSQPAGLAIPSLPVLGFGTQFVDADLDGALDLLVTNGHVDDHSAYGQPHRMRPQFFHNQGAGLFDERPAERLGAFFAGTYLGRGMARLDWNRDGREDVAVSHLDSPAALLTNRTRDPGHFLALRFVGTQSSRDPVGATVTVSLPDRRLIRQLTAGDGYQSSNQRQLVIGLGSDDIIDRLEVRWPSGRHNVWTDVPANRFLTIVENDERLFDEPVPQPG